MKDVFGCLVIGLLAMTLSGFGRDGSVSLPQLPVNDETVQALAGDIRDASVQKEAVYYDARKNRDNLQRKMYTESGTKIKFAMKEVAPGVHVQVVESIESREAPRFDQPLPNGPSEHPGWKFANNVVDKGFDTLKWVWTGDILGDAVQSGLKYAAKDPLVVRPEVVRQEVLVPVEGAIVPVVAPAPAL